MTRLRQTLQDAIMDLSLQPEAALVDKPGGIFIRRGEQMSTKIEPSCIRGTRHPGGRTLARSTSRSSGAGARNYRFPAQPTRRRLETARTEMPKRIWRFSMAWAGSAAMAANMSCLLGAGQTTPAPWVNVIANPQFGTVVPRAAALHLGQNSHEFGLLPGTTTRSPTPVARRSMSATRKPATSGRVAAACAWPKPVCRSHGRHTMFRVRRDGIVTELSIYVPPRTRQVRPAQDHQIARRQRELSTTGYWELVLANNARSHMHV